MVFNKDSIGVDRVVVEQGHEDDVLTQQHIPNPEGHSIRVPLPLPHRPHQQQLIINLIIQPPPPTTTTTINRQPNHLIQLIVTNHPPP